MIESDDILYFEKAPEDLSAHVFGFVRRKDLRGGDVVRILPETRASFQIFRADPYWLKEDAPGAVWRMAPRIGLWGPRLVSAFGFAEKTIDVFAVGLTPAGVRALTGRPAGAFVNDAVAPAIPAAVMEALEGGLHPGADFDEWRATAATALRRALLTTSPSPPIVRADIALAAADGSIPRAAQSLGLSERHFRRLFAAEHGAPPKTYARLLRFDAALKALHPRAWEPKPEHIPPYADQSHLIREFCAFAGITPAAYVRNKRRFGDRILRSIVIENAEPPPGFSRANARPSL